jgi:hypothetical protein
VAQRVSAQERHLELSMKEAIELIPDGVKADLDLYEKIGEGDSRRRGHRVAAVDNHASAATTSDAPQLAQEVSASPGIKGTLGLRGAQLAISEPDGAKVADRFSGGGVPANRIPDFRGGQHAAAAPVLLEMALNAQVAERLGCSPETVRTHRAHIMHKLDLHHKGELMRYAIGQSYVRFTSTGILHPGFKYRLSECRKWRDPDLAAICSPSPPQ